MRLPKKENISPTEIADPLKFYYFPVSSSFYIRRLSMVSSMLAGQRYHRLLDVGCGSGIFLKELETKCVNLYALDLHRKMLLVKDMAFKEQIHAHLLEGSITHLPFDSNLFDAVISVSVMEHVRDLNLAFSELKRVSKKNARIIIGFPVKNRATDQILKLAYRFLPNAVLEDEHVSDQNQIIRHAGRCFSNIEVFHFPSVLPLHLSLYCIIKIER